MVDRKMEDESVNALTDVEMQDLDWLVVYIKSKRREKVVDHDFERALRDTTLWDAVNRRDQR